MISLLATLGLSLSRKALSPGAQRWKAWKP
jgi:hypothetical protein